MKQSSVEKRIRRLRGQYRKRMAILAAIMLVIGIVLGIVADRKLLSPRDSATLVVPAATQEAEVTATPEPEVTPEPGDIDEGGDEDEGEDAPEASPTEAPREKGSRREDGDDDEQSFTISMGDEATVTATPEVHETPEPTPTVEPTPVPGPTTLAVVPFGESYTFDAQITSDGVARYRIEEGVPFETVTFTLTMKEHMLPSDYASEWGTKYKLKGTEAGAGFDLTLGEYTGTAPIIPQNILTVVLQSESGETTNPGYQMTDAEINGQNNVEIMPNATKTFWKRYVYSNAGEPMEYLSVSACVNGSVQTVLFELESDVVPTPDPMEIYTTLSRGTKSDAVIDLQKRLIELGYLSGTADGSYGEKTQTAVRNAQKDFGLEETGTATPEFQARLFSDQPVAEEKAAEDADAEDAEGGEAAAEEADGAEADEAEAEADEAEAEPSAAPTGTAGN